jgi:hypothetical protein
VPLHTDWVILRLRWRADPKKLFALKRIQTLDLMELYHKDQGLAT